MLLQPGKSVFIRLKLTLAAASCNFKKQVNRNRNKRHAQSAAENLTGRQLTLYSQRDPDKSHKSANRRNGDEPYPLRNFRIVNKLRYNRLHA